MILDLLGGEVPSADDPLGWLAACHRRLEVRLAWLETLARRLQGEGEELEAVAVMGQLQRYFSTALIHHHADEEESLFPRLVARVPELVAAIAAAQSEHEACEGLHVQFDRLASRVVAQERFQPGDPERVTELARGLLAAYTPHIEREDSLIFPAAARCLEASELARVGCEMQERRGLKPTGA